MSAENAVPRTRRMRKPRLPSHYNDRELIHLCQTNETKQFTLTKLVCMIAARDVKRICLADPDAVRRVTMIQDIEQAHVKMVCMLVESLTGVILSDEHARKLEADGMVFIREGLLLDSNSRKILEAESYDIEADSHVRSDAVQNAVALFAQRAARSWVTQTTSPLDRLQFSIPLSSLQGIDRSPCSRCGRSAALYCARCRIACPNVPLPPPVHLPVTLTIVHHDSDSTKKSTSVQACVLGDDVEFIEFRDGLPDFDPASTLLLFPSDKAISLDSPELVDRFPDIRRLIVIESSWQKSYSVQAVAQLARLTHCKLPQSTESCYWRYQEVSSNALSTIEASHAALLAIHRAKLGAETQSQSSCDTDRIDDNRLDDLLFIFAHQHRQITSRYLDSTQFKRPPKAWSVTTTTR